MANYTAADVKKLRDATGAGMMECKKALDEADGGYDAALEVLRVKGEAKAAKRGAERTASNGLVAAEDGAMVELASETDFVAKNEQFQALAASIVKAFAASSATDVDGLRAEKLADGKTVGEAVEGLAAVIGEKLELRRAAKLEGQVATYLHRKAKDLPPQVGVLVQYEGGDADAARTAAMQVAAMRPGYLTRDEVPADVVETEKRVAEAKAREEGKPEQALPKIIEGTVNGYYKNNVLLEQASVIDNKKSVKALLDDAGVTVTKFAHFEVGA
ncbi:translation elongation factor Ts [Jatrophihabitans fulvus]